MRSLADIQTEMTAAILGHDAPATVSGLRGGKEPVKRFAIHRRHYEASLVAALCQKFPACAWVVGEAFIGAAARAYVHAHPPGQPCIAEYGEAFPQHLAHVARERDLPYLDALATLEWRVGKATIATEAPPVTWEEIARLGSERLLDARLELQPGSSYVRAEWNVHELLQAFLSETAPDRFVLSRHDVTLEIRGARGSLALTRLDSGTFVLRSRLAAGHAIGAAAAEALETRPLMNIGEELRRIIDERLVVGISAA
jgi:hypothetical protein